jgi:hypothetical protein
MTLKQSTARNKDVLMVDSADHITGKTGLTLAITAGKDGGAFASISPTVTERGNGWYTIALTAAHTDTLGDLKLHITAAGADPRDVVWEVGTEIAGNVNMAQAVPVGNTANTIGDCWNAARAQGFGKWAISGTTLNMYAPDGSTIVRSFTLDSSSAPTSRT